MSDDPTLPSDDDAAALIAEFGEAEIEDDVSGGADDVGGADDDDARDRRAIYGGWAYLGFLFAVFLGLALFAYACDDDAPPVADTSLSPTTSAPADGALDPSELVFVVEGGTVTLTGVVPDDAARAQVVELAEARYGRENVTDELTVDDGFTLDAATVTMQGTADQGDENPEGLIADIVSAMNVSAGDFAVEFTAVEASAVNIEAAVTTDAVRLVGQAPDQSSVDALVAAATAVWGEGKVDATGLTIDDATTLDGGRIRVTGAADAGDARATAFESSLAASLAIDVENTVEIDTGAAALGRLEDRLRETLAANPILFASGSADIDPQSDAILQQAAAAINAAPGIAVEIVGHTDDQGADAANQALSEARATAVVNRLVTLGVDQTRLTARGAGETERVADNTTPEGRAANRRIAFEFAGAGEG